MSEPAFAQSHGTIDPVQFSDVWLRYGRRSEFVLRGVSGRLDPGDAVVVTGRNGAGKSTLLRLAAGLLRPTRGSVTERPVRIGFVPERFPADQPFTARRYLTLMAKVRGADPAGITPWAARLNFITLLDLPLPKLSKGSAQKVGLIQALLDAPDLLILDEPWEGLDAATRTEVPLIIAEVLAAGGSVLLSDHLGQTDELPGIRRWLLDEGELVAEEEPAGDDECVVEVAMTASAVPAAVANLQAAGHRILRVRGDAAPVGQPGVVSRETSGDA